MNRTSLEPRGGMIFVFAIDGTQRFWMKNTLVSLDMIFVRSDGTITSIAPHVPASTRTTSEDRIAIRQGTGKYVIELAAGEAKRAGLRAGLRLGIPSLESAD